MPLEPLLGSRTSDNGEVHNTPKNKSRRGRKRRKHLELASNTKSPQRSPLQISTRKSQRKIMKIDQKMHRMVFEEGGLPDGTEVAYYSNGKKSRDGYKMGSGIMCRCCSTLVSPSQFEAHAGRASRRKPYLYIYTSNGVSLHEFAVSLLKGRKLYAKDNDDLCIICADGGKLVLCDGCTRAFHKVVSAGILRIFGQDIAELPLAATRKGDHGRECKRSLKLLLS